MTAPRDSTAVEHHKPEASLLATASSKSSKLLERLPPKVRAKVFEPLTPKVQLDFLGTKPAKWPKKPSSPLLSSFPGLVNEIDEQVFAQTQYNFKSSTLRNGTVVHGCEVALAFLDHIKPVKVGFIRTITCDLDWHSKESANMLLQMLARLAIYPSRKINHIRFEFEAAPEAKRSKKGIVSKTFGFTLKGLIGLKITVFVVGLGRLPDADEFAARMNNWFRRHHELTSTIINRLERLPPEVRRLIYQNLPRDKYHHICDPALNLDSTTLYGPSMSSEHDNMSVLPSSSLDLLLVSRQMHADVTPIVFGDCSLELVTTSRWRHHRNNDRNETDQASWVTKRLHGLGDKAKFIRKVKIVLEMYSPHSRSYASQYTPSIKAIMDKVEECCNFQLAEGYRTLPNNEIPIVSVTWEPYIRKRCFLIKLPTRGSAELTVEVQTDFSYEAPGSLAYASQIHVVRDGYKNSVDGMRFTIDAFGAFIPA